MYPILFTWGEGALYTYTTMASLGIILGGYLWVREGKRMLGAKTDSLINAALLMFLLGFVGAKLLFILTNIENYRTGYFELSLSSGGIVFYGGMLGGALGLWNWTKHNGYSSRTTFNAMAPGLALGHAIGRLGCLAHGCCFGKVCDLPWGISYHDARSLARPLDTPLHPTQLYEFFGLLVIGAICLRQNQKRGTQSQSFRLYLLSYGTLRFFTEFLRGDWLRGVWFGLSTSQWVSLAMIISCLFLDFRGRNDHNSAHENRT